MIAPRWKKVIQDIFSNKTRTILTMLSIAVGVFAVGVITIIGNICLSDMQADYESAKHDLCESTITCPSASMREALPPGASTVTLSACSFTSPCETMTLPV